MSAAETLPALLLARAEAAPDRVFARVTAGGGERAVTFGKVATGAWAAARALAARGVRAGDVVPIALPTSPEYVFALFGVQLLGAAIAPVPPLTVEREERIRFHAERLAAVAACCGSKIAVTRPEAAALLGPHLAGSGLELLPVDALSEEAPAEIALAPFDDDRVAIVQFSSGSTAAPKGVRIRFRNILANAAAMGARAGMSASDSMLSFLPLFHDFGLFAGIIYPFVWDIPTWLYPTDEFMRRPSFWLKALGRSRATMCPAPQFVYQIALHRTRDRDLAGVDLSAWRVSFNGGEPIHAATLRAFNDRFASYGLSPTTVLPSYGMAECTLATSIHPPGEPLVVEQVARDLLAGSGLVSIAGPGDPAIDVVSCGPPLDGVGLAIFDPEGVELGERVVGEICLRGESVADDYVTGPGETVPLRRDEWFPTGDLGFVSGGNVFVVGRAKDIIIRGGRNYHPQDIEQTVQPLDGVRLNGVVAFGCFDPEESGDRIVVVVEQESPGHEALGSLPERARWAVYERLGIPLDDVVVRPRGWIPRTTSSKLQRARARQKYLAE